MSHILDHKLVQHVVERQRWIACAVVIIVHSHNGGFHPGGGTILQIPYFSAIGLILSMYTRGFNVNSSTVGKNVGPTGTSTPCGRDVSTRELAMACWRSFSSMVDAGPLYGVLGFLRTLFDDLELMLTSDDDLIYTLEWIMDKDKE